MRCSSLRALPATLSECVELERLMEMSIHEVLAEYRRHDMLLGRVVRVHHKTREEDDPRDFDAEAAGVSADGMLKVLPVGGGMIRELSGEEVSITPMHLAGPYMGGKEEL